MINKNILRKKIDLGIAMTWVAFLFSCGNRLTLSLWILAYVFWILINQNVALAVEFFILLQFRSLLSSGVAIDIGSVSMLKWASVISLSLFMIIKCEAEISPDIKKIRRLLLYFSAYLSVAALLMSSYPLVAVFKVVSYILPFIALIEAVSITGADKWMHMINITLGIMIVAGLALYKSSIGYLRNGRFFQGVFNHPNIMAVMCAIFIAGLWYEKNQEKKEFLFYILAGVCAFSIYSSYSRTGMISFLVICIVGICSLNTKTSNKVGLLVLMTMAALMVVIFNETWREDAVRYLFKGGSSIYDITNSREAQFERNLQRFSHSPLFGTGLNVPYNEGVRSFSFSFDLITENGNLISALLGDMGIIGTVIFALCYTRLFLYGKSNEKGYTIFIAPFLVSMGEMAFFSTNNFGIILYLYFAIYMSGKKKENPKNEDSIHNNYPISV